MRVICPNCSTEYEVPDAALAGRSRKLQCASCGGRWRAGPVEADPAPLHAALAPSAPAWPEDQSGSADSAFDSDTTFIVKPPREAAFDSDATLIVRPPAPEPVVAEAAGEAAGETAPMALPEPVLDVPAAPVVDTPAVEAAEPVPPEADWRSVLRGPIAPVLEAEAPVAVALEPMPLPEPGPVADEFELRRFGKPVDAAAEAELAQAAGLEAPPPVAEPEPEPEPGPGPGHEDAAPVDGAPVDEASGATVGEELPAFLTSARGPDTVYAEAAQPDRFAELVYAARNKAIEYEPEIVARPPPVRTSNTPLVVMLVIVFVAAMALMEHRLIMHVLPSTTKFFQALGLK